MDRHEAVVEAARRELRDHMSDFCRNAPTYIEQYTGALLAGSRKRPDVRLHPQLAGLLRDLILDAAMLERRGTCGAAAPTTSLTSGQGTVVSRKQSPRRKAVA